MECQQLCSNGKEGLFNGVKYSKGNMKWEKEMDLNWTKNVTEMANEMQKNMGERKGKW